MPVQPVQPVRFGRSSPVTIYWLARSEGFRVEGRHLHGVVEQVVGHAPGRPQALAVRSGLLGRLRVVPADAVEAVVPAEELILVDGFRGKRRRRRLPAPMGAFARRGGRVVASLLARGVRLGVSAALDVARLCGQGAVLLVRQSWALARADVEGARIGAEGAAELARTARPRVARAAKAVKARYVAWRLTAGR